jgi:hypothetical protein
MINEFKRALLAFTNVLPEGTSIMIELPNDIELSFHKSSLIKDRPGEFILLNSKASPEDVAFFNENIIDGCMEQLKVWDKLNNDDDIKTAMIKISESIIEKI